MTPRISTSASKTPRWQEYPQPQCDICGRFIPFEYGPNDFEWWSGGECKPGKGCKKDARQ